MSGSDSDSSDGKYRLDVVESSYLERKITSGKLRHDSPIILAIRILSASDSSMSGADIIRAVGYNRSEMYKCLTDLESSGLVSSEILGNVRNYTITDKGKIANEVIKSKYFKTTSS